MRCPTSILDRAPLEDAIFKTEFAKHHRDNKRLPPNAVERLIDALLRSAHAAIEVWFDLAFDNGEQTRVYSTRSQPKTRARMGKKIFRKITRKFVEFYWMLHANKGALEYLRDSPVSGYTVRDTSHLIQGLFDEHGRVSPFSVDSDWEPPGAPTEPDVINVPKSEPVDEDLALAHGPAYLEDASPSSSSHNGVSVPIPSTTDIDHPMPDATETLQSTETLLRRRPEVHEPIRDPPITVPRPSRPQRACTRKHEVPRVPEPQPAPNTPSRPKRACTLRAIDQPIPEAVPPPASTRATGKRKRESTHAAVASEALAVVETPARPKRAGAGVRRPAPEPTATDIRPRKPLAPSQVATDGIPSVEIEPPDASDVLSMIKTEMLNAVEPLSNPPLRRGGARGRGRVIIPRQHQRANTEPPNITLLLPSTSVAEPESQVDVEMVAAADFPLVVPPERIQRRMSLGDLLNSEDLHRFATEDDPAAIVKGEEQETQPPAIPHGILPKPPLQSFPPLWAQSRQEMCESSEWFRSYQGGIYQKNGIVKGYFLSGFGALRDRWEHDGKFIISHGGGKAESLVTTRGPRKKVISEETDQNKAPNAGQEAETSAATGQAHKQFVRPASDQTAQDASVRALMKNFETGQPLVLLIDDKYAHFPFDLSARGVYMTILGFYRVIHAWAEYQPSQSNPNGKVVRYKFAFQWCEGQGDPWWIPGPPTPMDLNESCVQGHETTTQSSPTLTSYTCSICGTTARQIYSPTWICLNPSCVRFFYGYVGNDAWRLLPYGADLEYKPDFLSLVDRDPLPSTFCNSLLPPPPNVNPEGGVMTNYASTRGWHCAECGRVSCRSAWEHYQCPNCNKTYKIVGSIRPARPLMAPPLTLPKDFVEGSFKLSSYAGVQCLPKRYFLHANPDEIQLLGTCQTFVLPDNRGKIHLIRSNISALKEADNIFESYQRQAFDGTLVFRRYPLRNHKLRGSLLTSYFSQNSGETYRYVGGTENTTPFDRAPSAVLRARDLIQKRIQEALDQPQEFNEILSAAYMERQEMGFHTDSEPGLGPVVAGLSMGSPALMRFRLALQYTPVGIQRQTLLTVVLRHGDVCVMDGADVQKFYEHTVVPTNFRIAATARWISPDKHLLPVKHTRIARPVLAPQTPIVKMEIECGGGLA